jgi:hypothetical protein
MKLSKIALAVAGAMFAGSAFALPQTAIDPEHPGANDLIVHYAGATAQSQAIKDMASAMCTSTSRTDYVNDTAINDATALVITCTLDTTAAVPASIRGKNLYFSYYLDGGSIYGVTPVADQIDLDYMKVFGGSCNASNECANDAANQYLAAPIAGGSDVEPAMFKGSNVRGLTFGAPQNLSDLFVDSAFNVVFGIALNLNLLDGTWDADGDGNPEYAGGTGTIKSLSRSSIATIFANQKAQWDAIPEYGNMQNWLDGVGSFEDIDVCRRAPGSGTQASAQAYFLDEECSETGRTFVTQAADPARVTEVSSSTTILAGCVDTKSHAIGISSLEKQPGGKYGSGWAYVAIDGIMPTTENAAMGKYDYMFENSMQYNTAVVSTEQEDFIKALFAVAKNDTCDSFTAGSECTAPKEGVLYIANFTNRFPGDWTDADTDGINGEYNTVNDVAWTTRDTKVCKRPTQLFP